MQWGSMPAPGLQAGLLVDTRVPDLLGFEFLSSVVSTVPGGAAICILDGHLCVWWGACWVPGDAAWPSQAVVAWCPPLSCARF